MNDPSNKYLDEFVGLSVASEMLKHKLFPNTKEITESFGAYHAVRQHVNASFGDSLTGVLCVGDGHTPRTGATFALRSAWQCFSVDPVMNARSGVFARLWTYRQKIEDWDSSVLRGLSHVIVVAVHSHASLKRSVEVVSRFVNRVSVVSIPCCVRNDLMAAPIVYTDPNIMSEHRTVFVWPDFIGGEM